MSKSVVSKSKAQASQSIVNSGLSQAAQSILVKNLSAKTIAGAAGFDPNSLQGDSVTLFLLIGDMTGSMLKNRAAFVQAHKELLGALKDSKAADSILMSVWVYNSGLGSKLVHSYLPLDLVPDLDTVYDPDGMTNLYDAQLDGITSLLQYEDVLVNGDQTDPAHVVGGGLRTQSVVVAMTDGGDNASRNAPADVQVVVKGLLNQEKYIFSLVAFNDPDNPIDPAQIAQNMGIPTTNVLSVGSTAHDIRHAMGTVSKSVIRASQTKIAGKSQSGFFTP